MAGEAGDGRRDDGTINTLPSGICLLSGEFPPDRGGVGDYTARLAEAVAALGVPVGVLTGRRAGRPLRSRHGRGEDGVSAGIPVLATVEGWDVRAWPRVRRVLGRLGRCPVLHIQYQTGAFGLQGAVNALPLWVRATLPRARVVTTFHDFRAPYLFPKAGPLRVEANRLLARASHAAIFSEPADLQAAGPGVRGYVVPIGSNVACAPPAGYDRARARRRLGADAETVLVGYFGFLNQSKGVPTLLHALRSLLDDGREVRLARIGGEAGASDPTDLAQAVRIRELIVGLGLGDRVAATGYLAPAELSAALLACDVLALPFSDGASLRRGSLMAGFAHGLPVVSTRGAEAEPPAPFATSDWAKGAGGLGWPLALRDGEQLSLVRPDDPPALARAIARLADDPARRARLAANGRAVAARASWPAIARQTVAIYEATCGA